MTLPRRQIILFLLIVLTPLAIAAWLGLEVARDEQRASRQQFQTLLQGRLRDVESTIADTVREVERHLLDQVLTGQATHIEQIPEKAPEQIVEPGQIPEAANPGLAPDAIDALRALRRSEPFVREVFVVNGQGRLVFPPDDNTASTDERAFRRRTQAIWQGDAVLYEPPRRDRMQLRENTAASTVKSGATGHAVAGKKPAQPDSSQGDSVLSLAASHEHGWISWYWEEGLHLLFWRRLGAGVVGVEVERVALIAHIVGKLPAAQPDDGRVVLINSRGAPVHQWGPYEPGAGDTPVVATPVRYPLDAWRLYHYASPAQMQALYGNTLRVNLIIGLAAVALALVAMAFFFYRDYAARMRDAGERVNFVTRVSHELKTPLTNIRLYAELVDNDLDNDLVAEDERVRRRLSVIIAESQRLTRLINNILAFSKKRRGQLEVRKAWIDINEVVDAVLDQFAPALEAKNIAWTMTRGASEKVHADADVIGQIVANLISNVEKYAAEGGAVEVSTGQQDGQIVVRVADRGPGIAPSHRDKIFRPFYRVSDRLADGVTGTGIGLSIARELARMSGGDLVLVPADVGACFELRLPTHKDNGNEGTGC